MREALLRVLASPCCRAELIPSREIRDDDIESGSLRCAACARTFPITGGVPQLLVDPRRVEQLSGFAYQWKLRERGKAEQGNQLWGVDQASLPYKLRRGNCFYLDIGCGPGEAIRQIALQNPTVQAVGADITDSVFEARRRDKDIPNLHYVRTDALQPAFRPDSFRHILALGVLHHTGDTETAVRATVRLLEKGGSASLWLYPNESDLRSAASIAEYKKWRHYYFIRDGLFFGRAHRIPAPVLGMLCGALSAVISPFGHLLSLDLPKQNGSLYRSNRFLLFDSLAARWQDRPAKQQVLTWLREAGFSKIILSADRVGLYTVLKT
jgi:uncharacterized protein YbaR (Trm112 family)/ubiquinone/menaquinone biosynthesis C-methylase UbiE